jgi:hypothetical protein
MWTRGMTHVTIAATTAACCLSTASSARAGTTTRTASATRAAFPTRVAPDPSNVPSPDSPPEVPGRIRPDGYRSARTDNWAGYVKVGGTNTQVSATWTEPSANCTRSPWAPSRDIWDVYFWVGLDGVYPSQTVEQDGTAVLCWHHQPHYYLWYEMYPAGPVFIDLSRPFLRPGDRVTASVTAHGTTFSLRIADLTRHRSYTMTRRSKAARTYSAEIVAEAPGGAWDPHPMPPFSTVYFDNVSIDRRPLGAVALWLFALYSRSGAYPLAVPSRIAHGRDFGVRWRRSS